MGEICKTTYLACPKCGSTNYTSSVYHEKVYDGWRFVEVKEYTTFHCEDCNCIFDIDDYGKVRTFDELIRGCTENIRKLADSVNNFRKTFAVFNHQVEKFGASIDDDLRTRLVNAFGITYDPDDFKRFQMDQLDSIRDEIIKDALRPYEGDASKFLKDVRQTIDFGEPIKPLSKQPTAVLLGMDLADVTIDEMHEMYHTLNDKCGTLTLEELENAMKDNVMNYVDGALGMAIGDGQNSNGDDND